MFVVTGDTHIYPYTWKSLPGVKGDAYNSFRQIVQFCIDQKAEALVLAGDVFDAAPTPDDVEFFLRCVERLTKAGVRIMAIQGQHGRSRTIPWTSIDPMVMWLHGMTPTTLSDGTVMMGFDNMAADELRMRLEALPHNVNFLVLHQLSRGACGDGVWDFDPAWVKPHVRLVILGDYHDTWEYTRDLEVTDGVSAKTFFTYTGSICMQAFDEPPRKSFMVVSRESGSFTTHRVPLKTRPFHSLYITKEEELIKILPVVAKMEPESLVLVKYDPRVDNVESRLREIAPGVHFAFRLMTLDMVALPTLDVKTLDGASLESCLSQMVDRTKDEGLHAFLLQLLRAKTTAAQMDVITKTRDRYMKTEAPKCELHVSAQPTSVSTPPVTSPLLVT